MRHPWRFSPASEGQSTAASKGEGKSKAVPLAEAVVEILPRKIANSLQAQPSSARSVNIAA